MILKGHTSSYVELRLWIALAKIVDNDVTYITKYHTSSQERVSAGQPKHAKLFYH